MDVAGNVRVVKERIAAAARRAGRAPEEVTLIAVSKGVASETIREALAAGVAALGENRVQEMVAKRAAVGEAAAWHFIGHLQTNKVRKLLRCGPVALIHSVDRLRLAETLDAEARRIGVVQPVLVELNVSGEAAKHGLAPGDLLPFLRCLAGMPGLSVRGLMTMAPETADPEEARPVFRGLRELFREAAVAGISGIRMEHLSMGMSGDYEVAVEEGATLVRVGRAIFSAVGGPAGHAAPAGDAAAAIEQMHE